MAIAAILSRGNAAKQFAQICFAVSIGITFSGPDETSVPTASGNTISSRVWCGKKMPEHSNWLSMLIILFHTNAVPHFSTNNTEADGTADFAIAAAEETVGSHWEFSPTFWDGEEMQYVSVAPVSEESLELEEDRI